MEDNNLRSNKGSRLSNLLGKVLLGGALTAGAFVGYDLIDKSVSEQQEIERIFNYKKTTVEDILENPDYYKKNPGVEFSFFPAYSEHIHNEKLSTSDFDIVMHSGGDPVYPSEVLTLSSRKEGPVIESSSYSYKENKEYFERINDRINELCVKKGRKVTVSALVKPFEISPNSISVISQSVKIGSGNNQEIYNLSDNQTWDLWNSNYNKYKDKLYK